MSDKAKQTSKASTPSQELGNTTLKQIWRDFVEDIKAKQSAPIVSLEDFQKTDEFKEGVARIQEGWAKRAPGRKLEVLGVKILPNVTFAGKKPK